MGKLKSVLVAVSVFISALASAQLAEPPSEIKSLDWLVGEWASVIKWKTMGSELDVPMVWKIEKEGPFLKQTSVMEVMGLKLNETSFFGWDAKKKKYGMHSFTNMAPTPRIEWGELKGNILVMISDPWNVPSPTGVATTSRATLTRSGSDIQFFLEFKNGEKWETVGAGTFKKKK